MTSSSQPRPAEPANNADAPTVVQLPKRNKMDHYMGIEVRTHTGQLVRIDCHPDDVDVMRAVFENVRRVKNPRTGSTYRDISASQKKHHHIYENWHTRFSMTQHAYAGGGHGGMGGYIEVLEIEGPPDDRHPIVLYWCEQEGPRDSAAFVEFDTVGNAKAAHKANWGKGHTELTGKMAQRKGFKRHVECGGLTPWFLAQGEESLLGDYTMPYGMEDDPVFRLGVQVLVFDDNGSSSVKTCMGCRFIEESHDHSYGHRRGVPDRYRMIYFSDGSIWNESRSLGSTPDPRVLRDEELWIGKAMREFHEMLRGGQDAFKVHFAGGLVFSGAVTGDKIRGHTREARYSARVTFSDGSTRDGGVDSQPPLSNH